MSSYNTYGYRQGGRGGTGYRGRNYDNGNYQPRYNASTLTDKEEETINRNFGDLFKKDYHFPLLTEKDKAPVNVKITEKLFTTERWKIPELMALKESINTTRNRLNEKDIKVWHEHTRKTNMTGQVAFTLRKRFNIEMCTNAWIKMTELLVRYRLIPINLPEKYFRSIHLCEAPGAFICATNHKLRQQHGSWGIGRVAPEFKWEWTGLSLNPYYEGNDAAAMVDDDRFIVETYKSWFFGVDNSGNILDQENIRCLWCEKKASLVTADGSVDASGDPNEQESIVSELHYAEAVTAMGILEKGGSLVLKMFNVFECETVCLLYILAVHFKELSISKPATSKAGNAETYVVARGFNGISSELLKHLLSFVSPVFPPNVAMLPLESIKEDKYFLSAMIECATKFTNWQKQAIERNLELEDLWNSNVATAVSNQVRDVTEAYISQYHIKEIHRNDRIVTWLELDGSAKNLGNSASLARGGLQQRTGGTLKNRREKKRKREEFVVGDKDTSEPETKKVNLGQGSSVVYGRQDIPETVSRLPLRSNTTIEVSSSSDSMSIGMRLMKKAGYKEGQGLGASEQGRVNPIEVFQREGNAGLGHHRAAIDDSDDDDNSMPTVPDEPFFDENKLPPSISYSQLPINKNCVLVGHKIKHVISSLFVRPDKFQKLYQTREVIHSLLVKTDSFKSYSRQLFLSDSLDSIPFDTRFQYPETALQLSSLDKKFNILPCDTLRQQLPFLVVSNKDQGFVEYISWQQRDLLKGQAFVPSSSLSSNSIISYHLFTEFFTVDQPVREKVSLIVADISASPDVALKSRYVEYEMKLQLTQLCRHALKCLTENGHFVCKVSDVFTRFTAGVIYLLYKSFKNIQIWKSFTLNPALPDRFLVCQGYLPIRSTGFIEHLDYVTAQLTVNRSDVLEIVPINCLLEREFQIYLADSALYLVQQETQALKKLLWCHRNEKLSSMSIKKHLIEAANLLNNTRRKVIVIEPDEGLKLPKGWTKNFSESKKLWYFFNTETGQSIWEQDWKGGTS
ncbi:unnamed protein product [Didymodactylos carnosus]|uniref:Cap-specific mRNA (nucleoside-2'-O-)-methyltransferase 1 n=1 Tax=Didymodactylos carnosus TaxID=1234261 RepID=A0A814BWF3_9BILA|nr:unnamed protein product [Didymodactylos carnosus]CAF1315857.1 unnamed protein product [Didymodactylos carnosus]CAF3711226.1 unnamed protein product [Didymodactylos carnosus]CAF4124813.1 unnamed protein product [Didymodactylos carnosus]